MSPTTPNAVSRAPAFAALGDETRLGIVERLSDGRPHSITGLSSGLPLTRQAVTKHLRVLETAGLVESTRTGRENLFQLRTERLEELRAYLSRISALWEESLDRLKTFVEDEKP
jgi:DNA-binding transcriptional ArsR family regulator